MRLLKNACLSQRCRVHDPSGLKRVPTIVWYTVTGGLAVLAFREGSSPGVLFAEDSMYCSDTTDESLDLCSRKCKKCY
jgi:hypothetical protein